MFYIAKRCFYYSNPMVAIHGQKELACDYEVGLIISFFLSWEDR